METGTLQGTPPTPLIPPLSKPAQMTSCHLISDYLGITCWTWRIHGPGLVVLSRVVNSSEKEKPDIVCVIVNRSGELPTTAIYYVLVHIIQLSEMLV